MHRAIPCRKPPEPQKAPAPKARPQWEGGRWVEKGGKGPKPPPFPPPPPPPKQPPPQSRDQVVWGVVAKLVERL